MITNKQRAAFQKWCADVHRICPDAYIAGDEQGAQATYWDSLHNPVVGNWWPTGGEVFEDIARLAQRVNVAREACPAFAEVPPDLRALLDEYRAAMRVHRTRS